MINVHEWKWVVDIDGMTCKNIENEVVINIRKDGETLRGEFRDMPIGLFSMIAKDANGEKVIEEIVKSAEKEYCKCFWSRRI